MNDAAICTEDEIRALVHDFYGRVRADAALGPVFDAHVADWDLHLVRLCDFWSSILLKTGRFNGSPMARHVALADLNASLFERWLSLFRQTAGEQANTAMAGQACLVAQRIADSLWMGYQISRDSKRIPVPLAGR